VEFYASYSSRYLTQQKGIKTDMKKIYKYHILPNTRINLPSEAKVIHVGLPDGAYAPYIWVELNPEDPVIERRFTMFGTGQGVTGQHLGTVFQGFFVWHIYETT
jgi:hypothetical protein